jgi:hypothetical protein
VNVLIVAAALLVTVLVAALIALWMSDAITPGVGTVVFLATVATVGPVAYLLGQRSKGDDG